MNSHYGIRYRTESGDTAIKIWCYQDGDLIPCRYIGRYNSRKTRDYHLAWSEAGVKRTLEVLYWHRLQDNEDPLGDVQDMVRKQLERKTQKIYQEARHETWKDRRERRAARAYGCAKEHHVKAMNEADPGSFD